MALAALFAVGCGKKKEAAFDLQKGCESLTRESTKDKPKFIEACLKVDPEVVRCVSRAKESKSSKGDSCDEVHTKIGYAPGNVWMELMAGKLGQQ